MRKSVLILTCCLVYTLSWAQQKEEPSPEGKNIVKLNLTALAFKNFTVQYERAISHKVSLAAAIRYMPESKLPFQSAIKNLIDDPSTERQVSNFKTGNFAFTPEARLYLGKKGALRGFYLGLFSTIARYTASLPYEYEDGLVTKVIPLSGSVTTITGGFMAGSQFQLSKRVSLDWWILGPNYGGSDGKISGQKSLTASEQQSLRDELAKLDIPLTKMTYEVNANGATVFFKGPWAGVRSGLCLGIRF